MKALHPINPLESGSEAKAASGATKGVRRTSGVAPEAGRCAFNGPIVTPDPEVAEKKKRRKFTAAYKLSIVQQAERCREPGEIGALLRREGLYSSHLATWRRQYENGALQGLHPQKRGRKRKPHDPSAERVAALEKENQRLKNQLRKAEIIIEAQKKISEILGIDQDPQGSSEKK